ncbi:MULTISPECIES: helix-turn-helix domain-containing protein [Corynebacterium]|uniref:helix-turn-helix domain-containing protein n=1 Tax=Corynebacterium TaxID=1716 RepID=UPI001EF169CB|nr:helix-turn-helix domain-containing protein [Corynebacterium kefirresidentii]MCG7241447.1 helix-turn-helix domain-containing protein [Corynebacterium kefirresidentii]MCG7283616.1 helix-turn-helix domain-containing protein [Corynebacterium kefirresidentii]
MTDIPAMREEVASRIKKARKSKGVTQEALAASMEARGVAIHASSIAKIESGRRSVEIVEALAIADALEMPWSEFMVKPIEREDGAERFRQEASRIIQAVEKNIRVNEEHLVELLELVKVWLESSPKIRIEWAKASEVDGKVEDIAKDLGDALLRLEEIAIATGLRGPFETDGDGLLTENFTPILVPPLHMLLQEDEDRQEILDDGSR